MELVAQLRRAHSMGVSKPEGRSLYGDAADRIEELEEACRVHAGSRDAAFAIIREIASFYPSDEMDACPAVAQDFLNGGRASQDRRPE